MHTYYTYSLTLLVVIRAEPKMRIQNNRSIIYRHEPRGEGYVKRDARTAATIVEE